MIRVLEKFMKNATIVGKNKKLVLNTLTYYHNFGANFQGLLKNFNFFETPTEPSTDQNPMQKRTNNYFLQKIL